ncbi:MAG: undecaprenyldiphospho-muramoylpentapeptide beta-N-acetylglucosaminyltransferase [Desulfobacteraceae bacterium]|nr:undecaprenyldiphospho-muramoylpentapeptide beta-N-acetylglucosaminyltransferase [Desulfobacteraceae bacterium]
MTDQKINILIAGGKTGGHLFPGIAIAQALKTENINVRILFAGIGTDFETKVIKNFGFSYAKLYSRPVKGRNPLSLIFSLGIIPLSIIQALLIIKRFKPAMVIGTGGYSSFAVVAGAWLVGIQTAIQEQNTIPGLTNRMLSKIVSLIFLNFKETKLLSEKKGAVHTGNPVRKITKDTDESDLSKTIDKEKFTLLISGGSQGASSINKAVLEALNLMDNIKKYNIIHQTGKNDEEQIQAQYSNLRIKNVIVKAFFNNLGLYQDIADLIICRAGAGTISEINLKGLPAILVPYPYAADDHQTSNANELTKTGAAIIIKDKDLTGQIVKQHIESLKNNKEQLVKMGKASLSMAMPDADIKIAKTILNMTLKQGI